MKTKIVLRRNFFPLLFFVANSFILSVTFSNNVKGQTNRAVDGEAAVCTIKANNKIYTVEPNQLGYFDEVSNISPGTIVPVAVYYPNGLAGQKVIISVEDGGSLDNGAAIRVVNLNNEKKVIFNFKVYDAGIHQISLSKGNDVKVVQIWGGGELNSNSLSIASNTAGKKSSGSGNNSTKGSNENATNCNRKTGDPFVPYTGNESRNIKDLEIWGGVGEAPFVWMRYSNSRIANFKNFFGLGSNWNHSFKYEMSDPGKNTDGQPKIIINYPEGGNERFTSFIWLSFMRIATLFRMHNVQLL